MAKWVWRCKKCNSRIDRTPCPIPGCGYGSRYKSKE